ncbi:hypothetical protein FOXG_06479 [Fusarium oxysporum f. sp. lycopersici 4287]|uniref:Uncharacterized protein n=1 Tax=Fusarium oxysporum f. sp. lycopersici (strain 4287 / CBS 123668 / FGSC 9935 / NRRL 34936) TaxID=426428 RepID=A0A0J9UZ15_FUSO4|nr:hypothetical protein FOXG_06479 [Fusarium oxysporum f. sp. lycopersici 4287]KAJ9419202.1 hypothetical protein QL093DRAFT_1440924 [Fusarium oxysporum]KNB04345.1 hypothetical protein FOXG_06479 [Fusarium oxysporum f. sp. lycopersici 4287]
METKNASDMRVEGVNSDDEGGKEGRRTHGGDEPIPAAFPSGLGGIARPGRLVAGHFAYKNNLPAVGNDIITFRARPWMHLPGSSSRGSFISSRGPLAAIDTVAQDPAIGAPTLLIRVSKRAPCILATAYTTAFSRLPPSHIPAWVPLRTLLPLALVTAVVLLRVRSSHRLPSVVAPRSVVEASSLHVFGSIARLQVRVPRPDEFVPNVMNGPGPCCCGYANRREVGLEEQQNSDYCGLFLPSFFPQLESKWHRNRYLESNYYKPCTTNTMTSKIFTLRNRTI